MNTPGTRRYVIHLGLGPVPAPTGEVLAAVAAQLVEHRPQIREQPDGQLVLELTVDATDLWLALLAAMNAATNLPYAPQWISVGPGASPPRRPMTS